MVQVNLTRLVSNNRGTLGVTSIDGDAICFTVEKAWLDNKPNVSCIPIGEYTCLKCQTGKTMPKKYRGETFEVMGVPNRSLIKIHVANYPSELRGCIAPNMGVDMRVMYGTSSSTATEKLLDAIGEINEFKLVIR